MVAAQLLNDTEPVPGLEQLQADISAAGGGALLAERIICHCNWAQLLRAPLTQEDSGAVAVAFETLVGDDTPDSTVYRFAVAVAGCCDIDTLTSLADLESVEELPFGEFYLYVLDQILCHPIPAGDAAMLLGGLQLHECDVHQYLAKTLVEKGTVGLLVPWVLNGATAGAAIGLLHELVPYETDIWRMALQAQPVILERVCSLTQDVAARNSAFQFLRLLCAERLIEVDATNEEQLLTAVRAVPIALAAAAEGSTLSAAAVRAAGAEYRFHGPPGLSGPDELAWNGLTFLNEVRVAAPGHIVADVAVLRAVAASVLAHANQHVTEEAYRFLCWALMTSPGMVHGVEAALPGICRDMPYQSPASPMPPACGLLFVMQKLPAGLRLLAKNQVVATALAQIRSDLEHQVGDERTLVCVQMLRCLLESDQASAVREMMISCSARDLVAMVGAVDARQLRRTIEKDDYEKDSMLRLTQYQVALHIARLLD